MPTEPLAPAIGLPPGPPSEEHYQAFCALLSQSERGRRLLAEHARRTRQPDTETLLAAIMRIELRLKADASVAQRLRDDLRMLLVAIRIARPEIDTAGPVTQVSKLKLLLDLLEWRLDALAGTEAAAAAPTDKTAPALPGAARGHLAVVPRPDEPELPISATDAQAPAIAVVPSAAMMRAIDFVESKSVVAESKTPSAPPCPPATPESDPLAAILALSEEERLALFT